MKYSELPGADIDAADIPTKDITRVCKNFENYYDTLS